MNAPKFSIGQHVAVCTEMAACVIPAGVVISCAFLGAGKRYNPALCRSEWHEAGWRYRVTNCPLNTWHREKWLRPIDPETEYQDDQIAELEQ